MTEIHLFGSLTDRFKKQQDRPITLDFGQPIPLIRILDRLDIPAHKVQLAMIDHKAVSSHALVPPGGRVALFPVEYPIFADWKETRI